MFSILKSIRLSQKLPELQGNVEALCGKSSSLRTGAFYDSVYSSGRLACPTGKNQGVVSIDFKASNYNSIYSGDTIQPLSYTTQFFIKY